MGERRLGRSVLALLAGFAMNIAITLATDVAMQKMGVLPALGQPAAGGALAVAAAYRALYSILSSYVVARLAPQQPMAHALIGGGIGLILSTGGAIANWNLSLGAHWYPLALIGLALPTAWVGGKLRVMQLPNGK